MCEGSHEIQFGRADLDFLLSDWSGEEIKQNLVGGAAGIWFWYLWNLVGPFFWNLVGALLEFGRGPFGIWSGPFWNLVGPFFEIWSGPFWNLVGALLEFGRARFRVLAPPLMGFLVAAVGSSSDLRTWCGALLARVGLAAPATARRETRQALECGAFYALASAAPFWRGMSC